MPLANFLSRLILIRSVNYKPQAHFVSDDLKPVTWQLVVPYWINIKPAHPSRCFSKYFFAQSHPRQKTSVMKMSKLFQHESLFEYAD